MLDSKPILRKFLWFTVNLLPAVVYLVWFCFFILSWNDEEIISGFEPYPTQFSLNSSTHLKIIDNDDDDYQVSIKRVFHRLQMKRQVITNDRTGKAFFQRNWEPSYTCAVHARMGQPGDGGKWVCDPHISLMAPDCVVYSVGSHDDFSFEEAIHSFNPKCEIHTFDIVPSVSKPDYVHFHPYGLVSSSIWSSGSDGFTIGDIMKRLRHGHISVLKVDCEGCEFNAFSSDNFPKFNDVNINSTKSKIGQILVEVHFEENPKQVHTLFRFLSDQGYAIFSKEPNIQYSRGNAVEYSLVYVGPNF